MSYAEITYLIAEVQDLRRLIGSTPLRLGEDNKAIDGRKDLDSLRTAVEDLKKEISILKTAQPVAPEPINTDDIVAKVLAAIPKDDLRSELDKHKSEVQLLLEKNKDSIDPSLIQNLTENLKTSTNELEEKIKKKS